MNNFQKAAVTSTLILSSFLAASMAKADINSGASYRLMATPISGRNDRVNHIRSVLNKGLLRSLIVKGKAVHIKLNPGELSKHAVLVAIQKIDKGAQAKITSWSSKSFKARWEAVGTNGKELKRVSILLNGKGHN